MLIVRLVITTRIFSVSLLYLIQIKVLKIISLYYSRTLAVSILSLRFCVFIAYCLVRVQPFIVFPFQRFITSFYRIRIPLAPSKYLYYMLGFNYFDSLFVFLRRSFLWAFHLCLCDVYECRCAVTAVIFIQWFYFNLGIYIRDPEIQSKSSFTGPVRSGSYTLSHQNQIFFASKF